MVESLSIIGKWPGQKNENGQEVKYLENIGDCQNQSWVVPGPSIPHLLTGGRGQNLQDKMFHTVSYISTSMFYLAAVQCVRGEDLVDCVMIGAGRLHLAIVALHCFALVVPLSYISLSFRSTVLVQSPSVLLVQVGMLVYGMVWDVIVWFGMIIFGTAWHGLYDCIYACMVYMVWYGLV